MDNKNLKYLIGTVILIGVIIISFPIYYAFSPDIANYNSRIEFNHIKWKEWQETEAAPSLRWDMTNDLIKKHKLKGLSITEITDLLGEPDSKNKTEFRYYLGMSRHGIDTGSLILIIENAKIIDYKVWHG